MGWQRSEVRDKIFPDVPYYMDCAGNEELAATAVLNPTSFAGRRVCRQDCLLAVVGRSQQLVKLTIAVQRSQQRIGKQVGVGAVVLFDRGLEHVEGRVFLACVSEERSLIVGILRVRV